MWKTAFENIGNKCILRLQASNYYRGGEAYKTKIDIVKSFDSEDESKAYFVSCAHTYLCGTFDLFFLQLKDLLPVIYHGNIIDPDKRFMIMDNFHKLVQLKELFSSWTPSVWRRANLITENIGLMHDCTPNVEELHYTHFYNMMQDMMKCAVAIKLALEDHLELVQKEWHEVNDQDIKENYSLKNDAA